MPAAKNKKSKQKSLNVNVSSDSENDNSEHELSYYMKDKVKLMKEVLKIIKPKKIKSMAPDCIKDLNTVEINSMLLEELLGISNKRLQYIFNGDNVDRESSSSDSEEEKKPIDVISLDDISDDDVIECYDDDDKKENPIGSSGLSDKSKKRKANKVKVERTDPYVKLEKNSKSKKIKKEPKKGSESKLSVEEENNKLMSVLELLELQARARAIRSQLALENEKRKDSENQTTEIKDDSDPEAVIIESPKNKEIVITSSDSETEDLLILCNNDASVSTDSAAPPNKKSKSNYGNCREDDGCDKKRKEKLLAKIQKIRLIRNKTTQNQADSPTDEASSSGLKNYTDHLIDVPKEDTNFNNSSETRPSENYKASEKSTNLQETFDKPQNDSNETLSQESCKGSEENTNFQETSEKPQNDDSNNSNATLPQGNCKIEENVNLPETFEKPQNDSNETLSQESCKASGTNTNLQETKKTQRGNIPCCDNDEIVINLDEDEMDCIENSG